MRPWALRVKKKADRLAVLWTARFVLLLAKLMPYRCGVWAGGFLGGLGYFVLRRERRRALEHLSAVFPERGDDWVRWTARASFVHLGKSLFELILITPDRLPRVARVEGRENIERAVALGKGTVWFTGHIGNWELSGAVIALTKPVSVVAAPLEPEPLNDLIVKLRKRVGMTVILRGRPGASRELIRVFKENRMLGLLIDQDTDVEGAFVDFMGKPAWTPTAVASMAFKFGAPVLFGYARRDPDGRHTITVEGPIELIRTGDEEKDIVANTALFTKKIEETIMKTPEQWVWMHRRWRRQP
jgi:Kdo2-lipid IVA lauroyltransferase/acyltransferase